MPIFAAPDVATLLSHARGPSAATARAIAP
jgi:hypothetical protein